VSGDEVAFDGAGSQSLDIDASAIVGDEDLQHPGAVTGFEDDFAGRCLVFGSGSAEQFALVMAQRKRMGRPIEAVDAQIAAIALAAQLKLVTRNTEDFTGIDGLEVINPWQPR
jgi:predicted nucleic acid-binding protein